MLEIMNKKDLFSFFLFYDIMERGERMRIDFYLKTIFHYSKEEISTMIKNQRIQIGERIVEKRNEEVNDVVYIDHKKVDLDPFIYVMYHKPSGVLSDIRSGILDSIEINRKEDLRIMGRLDRDTTGLMILTNDNHLIKEITIPGKHEKEYLVEARDPLKNLDELEKGIIIDNNIKCLPASYKIIDDHHMYLTIKEGKYHQIKKMMLSLGNEVVSLHRVSINGIKLDIEEGQYRMLSKEEIQILKGEK